MHDHAIAKPNLSRRGLLKGTLLAGAAALVHQALPGQLAAAGGSRAANTVGPVGHYPFTVGTLQGHVLSDGYLNLGSLVPNVIPNADAAVVAQLMGESFLPPNSAVAQLNTVLLRANGRNVLIDAGYGAFNDNSPEKGRQDAQLAAVGLTAADIDTVYITHAHPDHFHGFASKDGVARFPNAELVIGEEEYNFWSNPANEVPAIKALFETARAHFKAANGRLRTVKMGQEIASGVTAEAAFGHTPGHSVVRVASGGQQLLLTADTANHHVLFLRRPDYAFVFDGDPAAAAATRKRILEMAATDRLRVLGYHFPFPGIGNVRRHSDGGFEFVPAAWGEA